MISLEDMYLVLKGYTANFRTTAIHPEKAWQFVYLIKPRLDEIPNIDIVYPINLFHVGPNVKNEMIFVTADNKIYRGICEKVRFTFDITDPNGLSLHLGNDGNETAYTTFGLNLQENKVRIEDATRKISNGGY